MPKVSISAGAKKRRYNHDRSTLHVTTLDFGRIICSNILPLLSGDKASVDVQQFYRMQPLVVPTFGSAYLRTHAFFVPYRIIAPDWENWYEDTQDATLTKVIPSFSNWHLTSALISGGFATRVATYSSISAMRDSTCDFVVNNTATTWLGYNFTERGRWIYQVLCALGYAPCFSTNEYASAFTDHTPMSALPLLAFCRVLYDSIYPSAYVAQQGFGRLFLNGHNSGVPDFLQQCFRLLFLPYESDFYTSLWSDMNSVTGDNQSALHMKSGDNTPLDVHGTRDHVLVNNTAAFDSSGAAASLSAEVLRKMQALADYMTRNNIVGSRFVERLLARRGTLTRDQKLSCSQHIKSFSTSINIQDVTATTATDTQMLGEQGGKGHMYDSSKLSFEAKEDGFLLFVSCIQPTIGYVQGRKPWCNVWDSRLDYYTEDFDGKMMSPVPNKELFSAFRWSNVPSTVADRAEAWNDFISNGGNPDGVFGFAPIYYQWKKGYDILSGDFLLRSRNTGRESFHTFRLFEQPSSSNVFALNADFLRCDGEQYDRIFASDPTNGSGARYDHFIGYFNFRVNVSSHVLPLNSSMPMFDKSGEQLSVEKNGSKI